MPPGRRRQGRIVTYGGALCPSGNPVHRSGLRRSWPGAGPRLRLAHRRGCAAPGLPPRWPTASSSKACPVGLMNPPETVKAEDVPESVVRKDKSVRLAIADRPSAPAVRPKAGAARSRHPGGPALFQRASTCPRRRSTRPAGHATPDLYAGDIPGAIKACRMGLDCASRRPATTRPYRLAQGRDRCGPPRGHRHEDQPNEHPEWPSTISCWPSDIPRTP